MAAAIPTRPILRANTQQPLFDTPREARRSSKHRRPRGPPAREEATSRLNNSSSSSAADARGARQDHIWLSAAWTHRAGRPPRRAKGAIDIDSRRPRAPKPEEPDNCCMSGCVNCVWDRFRDEMEEWSLKNNEAQAALQKVEGSMDSDGGGSESNWAAPAPTVGDTKIAKDFWDERLYESVPVGIREFMKQEKRLKERHAREGTVGG
ncbi:hypothetical protein NW754_004303 [Fusarium falciforme]|nr:hypothetical protein NW754_004303 [Fusarium falciforme]